jgi:hypothetical protein
MRKNNPAGGSVAAPHSGGKNACFSHKTGSCNRRLRNFKPRLIACNSPIG